MTSRLAGAGLTARLLEDPMARPPPENSSAMVPAVSSAREANVATPPFTVTVVPASWAEPVPGAAVITVLSSPVSRFP